jgi:hypothetical protein
MEFSIGVSSIDATTRRGWNSALGFLQLKPPKERIEFSILVFFNQSNHNEGMEFCIAVQFLHSHTHFQKLKFNSYEHNLTASHFNAELDQTYCAFNMCSRCEGWLRRQT